MKTLLTLLLLIPSLSWGLTFKDGKQVDDKETVFQIEGSFDWKIDCGVDEGEISKEGNIWTFKAGKNQCTGEKWYSGEELKIHDANMAKIRTEIKTVKEFSPRINTTFKFESMIKINSTDQEPIKIFQIHDRRADCAPPLMIVLNEDNKLNWWSDYAIKNKNSEFPNCEEVIFNEGKTTIYRNGKEFKLTLNINFDGKGNFETMVFLDDKLEISGRYEIPKDGMKKRCKNENGKTVCKNEKVNYLRSKKFIFKHGIYSRNPTDTIMESQWDFIEVMDSEWNLIETSCEPTRKLVYKEGTNTPEWQEVCE